MSRVQTLSRGVILKFVSSVATLAGGFALSIFLNRHFGKEVYGLLVLVYTVTGLAYSIADFGAKRTLIRYLPPVVTGGSPTLLLGPLIRVSLLVQVAGALLSSAAIALFAPAIAANLFQKPELAPLLLVGAAYFFGFAMYDFVSQIYLSFQDWKKEAALAILFAGGQLGLVALGVTLLDVSMRGVLALNGIAALACALAGLALLPAGTAAQVFKGTTLREVRTYGRLIGGFGLPLTMGVINFYILGWADKAVIGRFHPAAELAVYYLAWLFVNGITQLLKVLQVVFLPYVSEISVREEAYLRSKFQLMFRWLMHASLMCAAAMFFWIDPLIRFAFGPTYSEVVLLFRLLLGVFVLRGAYHVCGMFITNAFNLVRSAFWLGILLVVTNVTLNVLLVPRLAAEGAALASFLAYAVFWAAGLIVVAQIRRMLPVRAVINAACALAAVVVISVLAARGGGVHPILLGLLAPSIYLAALIALREVTPRDIAILRESATVFQRPWTALA